MPFGIKTDSAPLSLPEDQRDLELWKSVCHKAIVQCTPKLTKQYATQANKEWDEFFEVGFQKLTTPLSKLARFPDSMFSLLFVWSVEYHLWTKNPDATREEIQTKFLTDSGLNERGFIQNWEIGQLGKTAIVLAACSKALEGRLELVTSALHWATEAEFLRRIRQAQKQKNQNDVVSFEALMLLRCVHTKSKQVSLANALDTIEKSKLYESERFRSAMTETKISATLDKWGNAYRIRCVWGQMNENEAR